MKNDDEMPRKPDPAWLAHKERTAGWRQETAFTEVFLSRFSNPEDAQAARWFGNLIECAPEEAGGDFPGESYVSRDLRAIVADLRRLEYELVQVAKEPENSILEDPKDLKLCRLAGKKAFAVARITDAIEQAIGPTHRLRGDRNGDE